MSWHCGSTTCPEHNFGGVNKDEVCRMKQPKPTFAFTAEDFNLGSPWDKEVNELNWKRAELANARLQAMLAEAPVVYSTPVITETSKTETDTWKTTWHDVSHATHKARLVDIKEIITLSDKDRDLLLEEIKK